MKASLIFGFLLNVILNYSFCGIKAELLQLFLIENFFMNCLSGLPLLAEVVPRLLGSGRDALGRRHSRWRLTH